MLFRVFIDGEAGTTGLQIRERLEGRRDLALVSIDPGKRKEVSERKRILNNVDAVILCLPDEAAREAAALIENPECKADRRLHRPSHRAGLGLWFSGNGQESTRQNRRRDPRV